MTATDSAFDSGIMNGGTSFSQSFTEPGSYAYFCLIHPEMRGTIAVSDPDPPTADAIDAGSATEGSAPGIPAPDLGAALGSLDAGAPTGASVSTIDRSFQPDVTEIVVGEAVTWTNDDSEGHTVTADDGSFNSGIMAIADTFSTTFDSAGTYDYFCAIHPEMTGTVTVLDPTT